MKLRCACVEEEEAVLSILNEGKAALAALGIDQWQGPHYPQCFVMEDLCNKCGYLLEDESDRPVAYFVLSFSGEADYDNIEGTWLTASTSVAPSYAVVHRVAVLKASRGKGAARQILTEAVRLAREKGAQSLRTDTHPGNIPMLSLLESCGFSLCGTITLSSADGCSTKRVAFEKLI